MTRLLLVILLLLAIGAQIAGWPQLTTRVLPDFTLAAVLAWTLSRGMRSGLVAAVGGGLLLDLYSQVMFGRFTIGMLLAFGVVALLTRGSSEDFGAGYSIFAATAAIITYEFWVLLFTNLTTEAFPFFAELWEVATLNCIATLIVFVCLLPLAGSLAARLPTPHEGRPV